MESQTATKVGLAPIMKGISQAFGRMFGTSDPLGIRIQLICGIGVLVAFFGIFGGWAAFAQLKSAAIASGLVIVESKRKTVQHLEGGIVREIFARDGDQIVVNQVLVRLDQTQPRATLELLLDRYRSAQTLEARLVAERDGLPEVYFPHELMKFARYPKVAEMIDGQRKIFESRKSSHSGQVDILQKRIAQSREEINGLKGQIDAEGTQVDLIVKEINDVRDLYNKGLAKQARLLALERKKAEIGGSLHNNRSMIGCARQSILELEAQITELATAQVNEVVQELRDVRQEKLEIQERLNAAKDVMARTYIRAPISGTVVESQLHTIGGVISPGEALMDIVPQGEKLVVEARIDPSDIDIVHPNLPAQVRFTAFSQRSTQPLDGKVVSVSADQLTDERTGLSYFLAKVVLPKESLKSLNGAHLYPGMQAEVMIVTGAQTPLEYLVRPLLDSFNRALRES